MRSWNHTGVLAGLERVARRVPASVERRAHERPVGRAAQEVGGAVEEGSQRGGPAAPLRRRPRRALRHGSPQRALQPERPARRGGQLGARRADVHVPDPDRGRQEPWRAGGARATRSRRPAPSRSARNSRRAARRSEPAVLPGGLEPVHVVGDRLAEAGEPSRARRPEPTNPRYRARSLRWRGHRRRLSTRAGPRPTRSAAWAGSSVVTPLTWTCAHAHDWPRPGRDSASFTTMLDSGSARPRRRLALDLVVGEDGENDPRPEPILRRRASRRVAPGQVGLAELDQREVVGLGVDDARPRPRADDDPRVESGHVAGSVEGEAHLRGSRVERHRDVDHGAWRDRPLAVDARDAGRHARPEPGQKGVAAERLGHRRLRPARPPDHAPSCGLELVNRDDLKSPAILRMRGFVPAGARRTPRPARATRRCRPSTERSSADTSTKRSSVRSTSAGWSGRGANFSRPVRSSPERAAAPSSTDASWCASPSRYGGAGRGVPSADRQ